MKKFLKGFVKVTVAVGTLVSGVTWAIFSFFLKRKKNVDYKRDTEQYLLDEDSVTDEHLIIDMVGLKWEREHEDICERLEVRSEDGLKLAGFYFDQGADKCVLLVHGINAWHGSKLWSAQTYFDEGYNVLAVDQRRYGDSEGKYCTMGYKESDDMIRWMHLLTEQKSQKQILMDGVSMGSATVMVCSGREDLPEEVTGIVADCGFTSTEAMMRYMIKHEYHIPFVFPLLNIVRLYSEKIGGFPIDERTPLQMVAKSKVPILFIHGTADDFVPYYMVDELYQACTSEKYILRVKDAVHALAGRKDPDGYREAVKTFIHKVERSA